MYKCMLKNYRKINNKIKIQNNNRNFKNYLHLSVIYFQFFDIYLIILNIS